MLFISCLFDQVLIVIAGSISDMASFYSWPTRVLMEYVLHTGRFKSCQSYEHIDILIERTVVTLGPHTKDIGMIDLTSV